MKNMSHDQKKFENNIRRHATLKHMLAEVSEG